MMLNFILLSIWQRNQGHSLCPGIPVPSPVPIKYSWVEWGNVSVKSLAKEHTSCWVLGPDLSTTTQMCSQSDHCMISTWLRFIFLDYNSNLLFKIDAGLLNHVQLNRYKISQSLGNSFKCFKVLAQPQNDLRRDTLGRWLGQVVRQLDL